MKRTSTAKNSQKYRQRQNKAAKTIALLEQRLREAEELLREGGGGAAGTITLLEQKLRKAEGLVKDKEYEAASAIIRLEQELRGAKELLSKTEEYVKRYKDERDYWADIAIRQTSANIFQGRNCFMHGAQLTGPGNRTNGG
ncbi:hypothetical protein K469DRAFT_703434 [Zopfia rhizophila CBS 207.26]|uniref:Uncharacterized protein n=1 Tax=Zopfia rhizophila CBS 207.26 TaxID=1314779 RepID=A0A6A6D7K9_9PEZI|nr:hypothetical protein K469DRAFT_703434 [Zopfia rhizophila CBS 207.26]